MTRRVPPKRKGDGATADLFFAIIPELLLYSTVSDGAVRLWGVLHRHADRGGVSWPSRSKLAELCGCSVATIDRRVTELVESGWTTVERRYDDAGDPTSNLYRLRVGSPTTGATVDASVEGPGSPTDDDRTRATNEGEPGKETGPVAQPADPAGSGRDLEPQGARSVERAGSDPARELVNMVWAKWKQTGRPLPTVRKGSPYMAVVQRVRTLLEAGHDLEHVAVAVYVHDGAWTNDSLLVTLGKVKRGRVDDPELARAMHDRAVADEMARLRARDEEVD